MIYIINCFFPFFISYAIIFLVIILKILFKNTTKYDENIYIKFLQFHYKKFNLSYTFYTAIVLIALFYCVAIQVINHNFTLAIIFCIALSVFFLWRFLHPVKEVSEYYHSDNIQSQKEFVFLFSDKKFKMRDGINFQVMKYSNLYRIFETEDFFYLYIDKSHSYLVSKSGFTKGSSSDFSDFIKKKYWWKYKKIT